MNIFFAVIAILGVLLSSNTSLKSLRTPSSLAIQEDNIAELEAIFLKKSQKIRTQRAALKKLKSPVVAPVATIDKEIRSFPVQELEREMEKIAKAIVPSTKVEVPKTSSSNAKVKPVVRAKKVSKRKINKIVKASKNDLNLSFNEIPTQKAIKLNKLARVSWTRLDTRLGNYGNSAYAKISTPKNFDRISTALSATEKSTYKESNPVALNSNMEVNAPKGSGSNDLVFFDYSKNEKSSKSTGSEFQAESPKIKASKNLLKQFGGSLTTQSSKNPYIAAIENEFSRKNRDYSQARKKVVPGPIEPDFFILDAKKLDTINYECLDESLLKNDQVFQTEYELILEEVDYSRSKSNTVKNFEVRFHDDPNIYKEDFGSGKINLDFKMNSQISVRRGTLFAKGYYRTSMDMVFEPGKVIAKVPMLTNDTFSSILSENNLKGIGASILVELDDKTEDVEIDLSKKYETKLYLNRDHEVVKREESEYDYILFIGVEPGNAILNFKRVDRKIINKLIYVAEDEIFYEPNFYAEVKFDRFSLYKEGLLSSCKSIVNIETDKIIPWNYSGKVKKESLNTVSLSRMIYPIGTKKYIEMSYPGISENIFIGRWGHENIVVPTEKYISHVLGQFDGQANNKSCVMQLNISKPIKEIQFNGQARYNGMNMQIKILDKDGEFYTDFSENSERAFLLGQEEGMVNIKINYADKSIQYLQSFCSDSTYIVEQL